MTARPLIPLAGERSAQHSPLARDTSLSHRAAGSTAIASRGTTWTTARRLAPASILRASCPPTSLSSRWDGGSVTWRASRRLTCVPGSLPASEGQGQHTDSGIGGRTASSCRSTAFGRLGTRRWLKVRLRPSSPEPSSSPVTAHASLASGAARTLQPPSPLVSTTSAGPVLEEAPSSPPSHILNGWIFALWGLRIWPWARRRSQPRGCTGEPVRLRETLPRYDVGWWSRYSLFPHAFTDLAKPFYHRLHADQLEVLGSSRRHPGFHRPGAVGWRSYDYHDTGSGLSPELASRRSTIGTDAIGEAIGTIKATFAAFVRYSGAPTSPKQHRAAGSRDRRLPRPSPERLEAHLEYSFVDTSYSRSRASSRRSRPVIGVGSRARAS